MATFGVYSIDKDGYNIVKCDNKLITKTGKGIDYRFGIRNNSNKILFDNTAIVNGPSKLGNVIKKGVPYLNGVDVLDNFDIQVIGQSYEELNKGNVPPGYKRYNTNQSYSIDHIDLEENVETDATFTKMLCPMLTLRPHTTRIKKGGSVTIGYFIDTFYTDSVKRDEYKDTFTVIVEGSNGQTLYKRTHYAGEGVAVIGPFNTVGEDWFSIRAIDQDGCSSPTVFADFLVEEEKTLNIFEVTNANKEEIYDRYYITEEHLQDQYTALTYGKTIDEIKANTTTILAQQRELDIKAYRNKLGLTKLFLDLKSGEFDGTCYDGVKLPENSYYEISYQRNLYLDAYYNLEPLEDNVAVYHNPGGKVEPSTGRFYRVLIEDGVYTEVNQITWEEFDWTLWYNLWNANGPYPNSFAFYKANYENEGYNGRIRYPKSPATTGFDTYMGSLANAYKTLHVGSSTPKVGDNIPSDFNLARGFVNGYYYIAKNPYGSTGVYTVTVPSNFILDMNGSTFKSYDSTSCINYRGDIIYLIGNFNTHIKNGKLISSYNSFNFHQGCILSDGDPFYISGGGGKICPGLGCVSFMGCKYCSLDNIEISQPLGYESNFSYHNTGNKEGSPSASAKVNGKPVNYLYVECRNDEYEQPNLIEYATLRYRYIIPNDNGDIGFSSSGYNKYVDLQGNEQNITEPIMAISNYLDSSKLNYIRNKTCISPYSFAHHGASHVMFVAMYNGSNFVKLVKTHKWFNLRIPSNVTKLRFIVYGQPGKFSEGGCWPTSGNNDIQIRSFQSCLNCECNDTFWHDTRSTAIHPASVRGLVFNRCHWDNIGNPSNATDDLNIYGVTRKFGDWEEGNWNIVNVTLRDCWLTNPAPTSGGRSIGFNPSGIFNMIGCQGIGLEASYSKNQRGIIKNCNIPYYGDGPLKDCENPQKIFRNNVVGEFNLHSYMPTYDYEKEKPTGNDYLNVHNKIQVDTVYAVKDCTFNIPIRQFHLHARRIRNGNVIID